jgi:hypothetical protein
MASGLWVELFVARPALFIIKWAKSKDQRETAKPDPSGKNMHPVSVSATPVKNPAREMKTIDP